MNNARYGALLNDLHNTFRMGRNDYPKTLTSAYNLSINWKGDTKGVGVTPNDGVAFTTESEEAEIHATNRVKMTRTCKLVICHRCGKATPWKGDLRVRKSEPTIPPKQGKNILRGPGTMHRGHEESPQG